MQFSGPLYQYSLYQHQYLDHHTDRLVWSFLPCISTTRFVPSPSRSAFLFLFYLLYTCILLHSAGYKKKERKPMTYRATKESKRKIERRSRDMMCTYVHMLLLKKERSITKLHKKRIKQSSRNTVDHHLRPSCVLFPLPTTTTTTTAPHIKTNRLPPSYQLFPLFY